MPCFLNHTQKEKPFSDSWFKENGPVQTNRTGLEKINQLLNLNHHTCMSTVV